MPKTVTASQVREWNRATPERMNALSAQAQHNVRVGARGIVHPEAVKAFNAKRRKDARYVTGNSLKVTAEHKATRQALIEKGLAGARGPLSKAAKASLKAQRG